MDAVKKYRFRCWAVATSYFWEKFQKRYQAKRFGNQRFWVIWHLQPMEVVAQQN